MISHQMLGCPILCTTPYRTTVANGRTKQHTAPKHLQAGLFRCGEAGEIGVKQKGVIWVGFHSYLLYDKNLDQKLEQFIYIYMI